MEVRGRPLSLRRRPGHLRGLVLDCKLAPLSRARAERITRTFALIERIAPVLEHALRDDDCFHSMYFALDASEAVLARFLVDW